MKLVEQVKFFSMSFVLLNCNIRSRQKLKFHWVYDHNKDYLPKSQVISYSLLRIKFADFNMENMSLHLTYYSERLSNPVNNSSSENRKDLYLKQQDIFLMINS